MIIKSLDKFNEIQAEINNSKVGSYVNLLKEELRHYKQALERAKLLENSYDINAAKARIETIEIKLKQPIRLNNIAMEGIDESELVPLAEAVWQEGEDLQLELRNRIEAQQDLCLDIKQQYFEELSRIAELKKQSEKVAYQASTVRLVLRKNEMKTHHVNIDNFIIDRNQVDKLTR